MKLSLSKGELLQILSEHFAREVTEVTITKGESPLSEKVKHFLGKELRIAVNFPSFQGANKIPAIKTLRSYVDGMGLAEAKWAIENWNEWIGFVEAKNRYPKISFNDQWGLNPVKLS